MHTRPPSGPSELTAIKAVMQTLPQRKVDGRAGARACRRELAMGTDRLELASRVEVSNNAREYTSSGVRVRLVSVRVVDVHPWSGPVGGATCTRGAVRWAARRW